MKCVRCGTNVDREVHDRGICFDCYCQLDMQEYESFLRLMEEEQMPFVYLRYGDRLGCGYEPGGYSSLKKSGVLDRQWCLKCGHRCWIYLGERFRCLELKVKVQ